MDSGEIERELEELESRVERLRALYEQYFMGIEKMEPQIPRKDVERRIWILRREQIRNTGLRFKFQMIIQRYNTFQQYWGRVAREIENGTYRRDVMRAAIRFGEKDALTVLGKKRADQYKTLLENQRKLRESGRKATAEVLGETAAAVDRVEEAPAPRGPAWGDITEVMGAHEDLPIEADGDEVTPASAHREADPARRSAIAEAPNAPPRPPPGARAGEEASAATTLAGLRWRPGSARDAPAPTPSEPTVAAPPAAASSETTTVGAPANPRQRVAELAAEMRARKAGQEAERVRPDTLDLDFDADMTLPQPILPSPLLPNGGGVPAGPPKRRRSSKSMRAVRVEETPPPAAAGPIAAAPAFDAVAGPKAPPAGPARPVSPAPPTGIAAPSAPPRPGPPARPPQAPSRAPPPPAPGARAPTAAAAPPTAGAPPTIHDPDAPWNEQTQPSLRRKLAAVAAGEATASPAPPVKAPASPALPVPGARLPARPVPPARPSEPTNAEPAARRTPQELSDQRIRQIYSKYVETKRAANEPIAGVTYERLAESLRAQADKLRSSHPTKSVDYEVVTKDGKTMLKPILR